MRATMKILLVYGLLACTGLYMLPVGMKALTARYRRTLSPFQEVHG